MRYIAIAIVCTALSGLSWYYAEPTVDRIREAFDSAARQAVAEAIAASQFTVESRTCAISFEDTEPLSVSVPGCRIEVRR